MSDYHYIQSEPGLWTVGTGTPGKGGDWEPESDHDSPQKAAERAHWLNGGSDTETATLKADAQFMANVWKTLRTQGWQSIVEHGDIEGIDFVVDRILGGEA